MSFAALSTVIAVFENLISFSMDKWGWSRKTAVACNGRARRRAEPAVRARVQRAWRASQMPGIGDIQSIEDFIVSNNMLPLGSTDLRAVLRDAARGWGWKNFLAEADAGDGHAVSRMERACG